MLVLVELARIEMVSNSPPTASVPATLPDTPAVNMVVAPLVAAVNRLRAGPSP